MLLASSRNPGHTASFREALQRGTAPDGGLYVPVSLPVFAEAPDLWDLAFPARSTAILDRLLGAEFPRRELEEVVAGAFDFPLVATAHPAKFQEALGRTGPLPPALEAVRKRPVLSRRIPADAALLAALLEAGT